MISMTGQNQSQRQQVQERKADRNAYRTMEFEQAMFNSSSFGLTSAT